MQRGSDFEARLQADVKEKRRFKTVEVTSKNGNIKVEYQSFDIGTAQSLFDENPVTLARTERINPARILIHIPPTPIQRIFVTISHVQQAFMQVETSSADGVIDWGGQPYSRTGPERPEVLTFQQSAPLQGVTRIGIDFRITNSGTEAHVHFNEIDWE